MKFNYKKVIELFIKKISIFCCSLDTLWKILNLDLDIIVSLTDKYGLHDELLHKHWIFEEFLPGKTEELLIGKPGFVEELLLHKHWLFEELFQDKTEELLIGKHWLSYHADMGDTWRYLMIKNYL
jgi:hypothetical protein